MIRLWLAQRIAPRSHVVLPRQPTREMLHAAASAMSPGRRPTDQWVSNSMKHSIRYLAMVAATEKETA
jgi:hypothetical protein